MTDKIKVAVRVRPFNRREFELGAESVIEMNGQQTLLSSPESLDKGDRKSPKTFAFDHCFYSVDPEAENFASQQNVFDSVGRGILDNAFQGYNACIFAYGQTGSGKSYTMMGTQEHKGIIPRLCDELFASIGRMETPHLLYKVEVSYIEIYNEKVHDLLDPKPNKHSLKVREHKVLGPYVDGLSQLAVTSFEDVDKLMGEGNKSRTVAATNMNAESSRSHAVFSVILTQTLTDPHTTVSGEKVSRMSLVDLAGSERAIKTGAVGDRLKEGSNINKSLTTLGLVISKLADQSTGRNKNDKFVPYRDSVLTWLLKDNLGGNSRTVMLATISPASDNYEETLSTLRYADRAKRIVNHAVINEDPNARIIRELRLEVENLRNMLKHATGTLAGDTQRVDIHDKLAESENLMKQISQTWEEKLVKTERIQNERQQALEKMGISVQASGIKVEKDKYYLVNLNADPSLNELLVYYLKDHTLVGGRSNNCEPDIQLFGLGIQPEHCKLIIDNGDLYMEPMKNARCFVNGSAVYKKILLHHGDRILWGNHHFFRVNCPRTAVNVNMSSEPQTPATQIDYHFARDEIMQNELSNDPIQAAIAKLERQHEEDKQVALEKQRQEYEKQFQQLRNILSPTTPYAPYHPYDPLRLGKLSPYTPTSQMRVEKWARERDEMFKRSLGQLKMDIMKANTLVQEANFLADEIGKHTKFSVTLQIPPANLSPNRRRGAFVSEPAILVKRTNSGSQVWSMEKLENKLIDMREMYQEHKEKSMLGWEDEGSCVDPFYESQENHNLIGVANIFLEVLFHDVNLDYQIPIISQQGEVAGRLQIEISRIAGQLPHDRMCESISDSSADSRDEECISDTTCTQITCRVSIKQATGLPLSLSNFVFCQYTFWGHQEVVVPLLHSELPESNQNSVFRFNHVRDYTVTLTEEFLEHCAEGALSVEVWGHRSAGFSKSKGWEVEQQQAKARSLVDRWAELSRKIELWVEIHELNDNGEYSPVEVINRSEVLTGGIYQLRQGQQKRIQVHVKPVQNSGTLPIICQSIVNISVGSITVRSKLQKPLDSYQEEDLSLLREKWSEALGRRRKYLDQQIQKLINKEDKTEEERDRELSLVHQWVSLTEERNAVLVPAPGSGIPGAPASWDPPQGMEPHVPVLFLDLNADDLSTQNNLDEFPLAGVNSILPKEHGNKFYQLQILQHIDKDISAVASWDSSLHENHKLNRVTEMSERVYLILKCTVRLSHPAPMDLVLRKRLSLNIYKRQSIAEKLKRLRFVRVENAIFHTGVTYEIVSNIPKASEELEDRESLAQLAASGNETFDSDGETYIEKYTRGVSAVESILILDRLRQSVAIKELEQIHGQNLTMRKTVSVPNFSQIMRFDTSMEALSSLGRSESYADLNNSGLTFDGPIAWPSLMNQKGHQVARDIGVRSRHIGSNKGTTVTDDSSAKSLGIASPAGCKLTSVRMTTLHEEPVFRRHLSDDGEDNNIGSEIIESEYRKIEDSEIYRPRMTASKTMDSLLDASNIHNFSYLGTAHIHRPLAGLVTPSMSSSASSGYGSQAASYSNLTNDDISILRIGSLDDNQDFESQSLNIANSESPLNRVQIQNKFNDRQIRFNPFMKETVPDSKNEVNVTRSSNDEIILSTEQMSSSTNIKLDKCTTNLTENDLDLNVNDNNKNLINDLNHNTTDIESTLSDSDVTSYIENIQNIQHTKALVMTDKNINQRSIFSTATYETQSKNEEMKSVEIETEVQSKLNPIEIIEDDVKNHHDTIPNWINIGESVLIRPYNSSGVICFIGTTHFQSGIWVGVELDTPTGKNNGTVQGIQYFSCKPKHGIFVRYDKLMPDKRGKLVRTFKMEASLKSTENNSAQTRIRIQPRK